MKQTIAAAIGPMDALSYLSKISISLLSFGRVLSWVGSDQDRWIEKRYELTGEVNVLVKVVLYANRQSLLFFMTIKQLPFNIIDLYQQFWTFAYFLNKWLTLEFTVVCEILFIT